MSKRHRPASATSVAVRGVLLMLVTAVAIMGFLSTIIIVGMRGIARDRADSGTPRKLPSDAAASSQTQPATRPDVPPSAVATTAAVRGNAIVAERKKESPPAVAPEGRATATLVRVDDTSQGGWVGRYGMQGYSLAIPGATPHVPPGVDMGMSTSQFYLWATETTDPRGLSIPETPAKRSAGQWWSWDRLSADLDFRATGKSYQVGLYLLDWDSDARAQQMEVVDVGSGAVLLSRTDEHFRQGRYVILRLSGHVMVRITGAGGANRTLSGIFFDDPLPVTH